MRKLSCLVGLFIAALLSVDANSRPDQFTPLIASGLTANTRPFLGTDGRVHLVYELVLTNANPTAATLEKIEVLDAPNSPKALARYEGQELLAHLRTTGSSAAESPTMEFNNTRLFLIDLTLDSADPVPARLWHHIDVSAAPAPDHTPTTPVPLSYTAAPVDISRKRPEIAAPLSGNGWVAANGCCGVAGVHRSTSLTVNGGIYFAQRFAIDWMRLDDSGQLVHGDPSDVHSYPGYGADVLAVADGKVVDTLNTLDDQKPGTLPDRKTITLENVDGNHVVLDLGDGVFAFYAHLQKGSVKVALGERVKRGQVLGKLGNTGNTSAPHLHFHLMEGSSVLGSNGMPYVFNSFALAGNVPAAEFAAAPSIEGVWNQGLLPTPSPRHGQYPLDLNIVNFPSAH
jgi:Peptidase family M23